MNNKKQKPRRGKEASLEKIQTAARKVFFEKGYPSCTMEDIAKSAGVAKGSIYLYFENKDDLYISLMLPTVEDLNKRFKRLEKKMDHLKFKNAKELLREIKDVFYNWYRNDKDGFRISSTFQQGNLYSRMSKTTLEKLNRAGREGFGILRGIISKGRSMGLIRREVNEIILSDFTYAMFLGLTQLEETKSRITKKDHILTTLNYAFSIISDGVCSNTGGG